MPDEKKTIERYDIIERPDPDAPDRPWTVIDTYQDVEVARYPTVGEALASLKLWRNVVDEDAQLKKQLARIERELAAIATEGNRRQAPWWFLLAVFGGCLVIFCTGLGLSILLWKLL